MSSFTETPNLEKYINRGADILENNGVLVNTGTPEDSKVTSILRQEPPIDQSPSDSVMPVIYVAYSKNPMGDIIPIGRDSLDADGPKYYNLEFYNVIIDQGLDKESTLKSVQELSQLVRDIYLKNKRMTDPANPGTDPFCSMLTVVPVPFVLRSSDTKVQAINVIVRPQVPIQL